MRKAIYLCGPIHGKTDAECRDWRQQAIKRLSGHFWVLDPLFTDYRGHEEGNAQLIVNLDLSRIKDSDALIVNAIGPGWGTAMETRDAFLSGRHVVAFGAPENPSPWLVAHTHQLVATLDDACDHIYRIFDYAT